MPLLALPREMRDKIYYHYVYEDDGYRYDFTSGKLQASNGRNIDLALMYTCKPIAAEMRHVALGSNIINFTTISSESVYMNAGRFNRYFLAVDYYKSGILKTLNEPEFHHFVTPDLQAAVALRYPQLECMFHEFRKIINSDDWGQLKLWSPFCKPYEEACSSYGEADSFFRGFQDYILQILFKDTTFHAALLEYCGIDSGERIFSMSSGRTGFRETMAHLLRIGSGIPILDPWSIPSERELAKMDRFADPRTLDRWHEMWRCLKNR